MKVIRAAVLGILFCTAVLASSKARKDERRVAYFGENIDITVPPGNVSEVVFIPSNQSFDQVVLMQAGQVVQKDQVVQTHQGLRPRYYVNTQGHLVLQQVKEEDEGMYVVRKTNDSTVIKRLILTVRDCSVEQVVKYGESYYMHLNPADSPIVLEFRPSPAQVNQTEGIPVTEPPPILLYNMSTVTAEEYVGRLSVTDKRVTLHSVRMTDEGSFTVRDRQGAVKGRSCLNVREHQNFEHIPYGENLKIRLYMHRANLNIVYRPKSDNQDRVILEQGVLVTPLDPMLEGRLTVEGSELIMKKVQVSDTGVFKVTDLAGFPVAHVYIEVDAYKLPPLTVAILSMLSLIAFMLLVCLLSCLYKVHKRNEKNKKLTLIAQQAGKGDGEAFRQVVHDAYTRFTEESITQSVSDKPSERTEVTIKGLEVSKPGRYQALSSDNFLEMSDSGAECTSGLPLDSDTDAALTYASHKPLLNAMFPTAVADGVHSDSLEATVVPDGELSASRTPDSVASASPASNPRSLEAATPVGSLHSAASPGMASRGTAGSDSAKTEEGAENGEAGQKEESAQST
ncbi:uncharacterized protein LOC113153625 [Anabas testudineus]|uniref:Uncharacterized protein n=1 Tax=Anabas testudineus TaxID=64144 RepID=A0A3Q1GZ61_ANATE|nr:uncharacterized protein LOC113153625 [Anabas testudineus]